MAAEAVTIPDPPGDGLGALPPPDGWPAAYCPALRQGKIVNGVRPEGAPAGVAQDGQPPVDASDPTSLDDQLKAALARQQAASPADPDDPYAGSSLFSAAASRRKSRQGRDEPGSSLFDDATATQDSQSAKPKVDLVAMMNSGGYNPNVVDKPLFTAEAAMDDDQNDDDDDDLLSELTKPKE